MLMSRVTTEKSQIRNNGCRASQNNATELKLCGKLAEIS